MPLVPPALAFIIGIFLQHFLTSMATAWIMLPLALSVVAIGLCLTFNAPPRTTMLCIVLLFSSIGMLIGHISEPINKVNHYTHFADGRHTATLRLTTTPYFTGQRIQAQANVESIDGRSTCGQLHLFITTDSLHAQPTLYYGDTLLANGLLLSHRKQMYIYSTAIDTIYVCMSPNLRKRCEDIRVSLLQRMHRGPMDDQKTAISAALVLGWKSEIAPPTYKAFKDAGISHLLAVSGLHVGIVAALVEAMLFFLPRTRRGRALKGSVQFALVWIFVAISGAAPSSIRAALMISCFIIARVIGRRTSSLNILALTAIITLANSPQLLFDTGWQLSYAAVGGLLCCSPFFNKIENKIMRYMAVSTVAYISTLPITATIFHNLLPYFLVANVIIVPMASLLVGASLLYMIAPCSFSQLFLMPLLDFTQLVSTTVSQWPHANIVITSTSPIFSILLWVGCICIILSLRFLAQRREITWPV